MPDRVGRAVLGVTGVALLARLVLLGQRIAHWDEARVAYWLLNRPENGWVYRPIIHGPFVQHTTRLVFDVLGTTDATKRLVVAVVGGLLPLAALLFRSRLADDETVALAAVLAANPLLLYFSRFMRSDVPLAAFSLVAFGFALRAVDRGRRRDLLGAGLALGFAFTTKENAVLYLCSWAGAAAVLAVPVVYRRHRAGRLAGPLRGAGERFRGWLPTGVAAVAVFAVVFVVFYAPRAGPDGGLGLWRVLAGRGSVLALLEAATVVPLERAADLWLSGPTTHPYGPYLLHFAVVTAVGAASTVAFALVGLATVRSTGRSVDRPRRLLVGFCCWWALSAFLGYPYATDIKAPWLAVHVVVALAVPAAVGIAAAVRRARAAPAGGPVLRRNADTVFAALLVVSAVQVGAVAVGTSYTYPTHSANVIAQSAQPGSDLRPTLDDIERADGVLYYGSLAVADERRNDHPPAAANWYDRLPLPWYTERAGVRVESARSPSALPSDPPAVVVVRPSEEGEIADRLDGYVRRERAILQLGTNRTLSVAGYERDFGGRSLVYYLDVSALGD